MAGRRNPYEMIERMLEQMNRQFDEASRMLEPGEGTGGAGGFGTMGVDLADRGEEFVVTADVPGFEHDEIDLRLLDGALAIEATKQRSTEEQAETYIRSERERRSIRERVALPEPVSEEGVEARLQNGVLTVTLPKAEPTEQGGRRIDIE